MIRRATHCDIGALREIWTEVFNDSPLFLDRFFGNLFVPDSCLVAEKEGQIAAMLFLLEATASYPQGDRPLRYVYACATHPAFREKGLMGMLLGAAIQLADDEEFGLVLIPANEQLFLYYMRFGFTYKTALYRCSYPPLRAEDAATGWERADVTDTPRMVAILQELRAWFLRQKNAVLWPDAHIKVALEELQTQGGELLLLRSKRSKYHGYALTRPRNEGVEIVECASVGPQEKLIASLRHHYNGYETRFTLSTPTQSCTRTAYGLLYTPNPGIQPLYLNLGLE